jgi:hypothetical protein
MSNRRRHRWFRRMALGLAFASVMLAGRVSVAAAKFDEGTSGSRYVSAGGWSGAVDMESGVPLAAGIPEGDEQFIASQSVPVIPYLSHGILSEADAQAASAEAIHDPYLTDLFVRPGESLGGPDGQSSQGWTVVPYLSHGILTEADAQLAAAAVIPDPNLARLDGDQIALQNAITSQQTAYVPGVTDFPTTQVETPPVRPDDVADRFAHSDVTSAPQVVSSSSDSGIEWNEAVTAGIGILVLGLGLGLAFGHLRRPKLAGL